MRTTLLGSALAACVLLTACGSGTGTGEVAAAGGDTASVEPTPTVSPTVAPTAAPYPGFEATDYSYVLRVSCFCPDVDPVLVTVEDGQVVSAVDKKTGDDASKYRRLTIDDVIDAANKADAQGAARLDVRWRDGEAYPRSVYIDQDRMMADEEIGYSIRNVQVAS